MIVGRNQDCPCGSGKKYKKCCLNNVVSMYMEGMGFYWQEDVLLEWLKEQ